MKKLVLLFLAAAPLVAYNQCTVTNATDCHCLDGSDECDLLPDITLSHDQFEEPGNVIINPGLIQLGIGTPNIGHGPLRVISTDYYVCGLDTIYDPTGLETCPDGTIPRQIINQRIYHKNGSEMTYWEKAAGSMTYHPDHGHFHTDNWGVYTLRKPIDGVEDPTEWPILGYGTKMGFCLMDLANCASPGNYGYCREDDETVITNDIENYGLGGGNYSCAISNQGISVGYLDIYDWYLDGMEIVLPEGVCNGEYYIVVTVDPNLNYIEESDDNNVMAMPFTLTGQPEEIDELNLAYTGGNELSPGVLTICASETVELNVPPIGIGYTWSNGATTNTITISEPGTYYCFVERECGDIYTDTIVVEMVESTLATISPAAPVCVGSATEINATGDGIINWYSAAVGGTFLGTGATLLTAPLFENTMFYAENVTEIVNEVNAYVGQVNHEGSDYSTGSPYNGFEVFNAIEDLTLESVKVYTDFPGERTIEVRDEAGVVIASSLVNIPSGTTVIDLGFDIPAGSNYKLGTSDATNTATFGDISPKLKRSTAGTNYPYNVDGLISITNSSFDESRWYYFYDWHVTGNSVFACPSERTGVEVEVKVCTGIGEVSSLNAFNVYPNPNQGMFNVELNSSPVDAVEVSVLNVTGQEVYSKLLNNVNGTVNIPVDLSDNAAGVYVVKITSNGNAVSKNVVVE
ncbi:MAG TPA: T9SS type A sorting domain-containing protein [Chitinophagales bacterium]|nr:T9SS type A sorting domain-containing protein [Chitinophagales bacterium]